MIKVLKEGLFTTIQDIGRFGYKNIGVPVSGSMDQTSAKLANLLLGNDESSAVLEMTLVGPTLEFMNDTYISITGADMIPSLNKQKLLQNKHPSQFFLHLITILDDLGAYHQMSRCMLLWILEVGLCCRCLLYTSPSPRD